MAPMRLRSMSFIRWPELKKIAAARSRTAADARKYGLKVKTLAKSADAAVT